MHKLDREHKKLNVFVGQDDLAESDALKGKLTSSGVKQGSVALLFSNLPWGCLADSPHDVACSRTALQTLFAQARFFLRRDGYVLLMPGPDTEYSNLIKVVAEESEFEYVDKHLLHSKSKLLLLLNTTYNRLTIVHVVAPLFRIEKSEKLKLNLLKVLRFRRANTTGSSQ